MKLKAIVLGSIAGLAIAGCSGPEGQMPAQATPAATAAPAPEAPVPAPALATVTDMKAFAGVFDGTLPCPDCQGIQTKLTLNADGSYQLDETFAGRVTNNQLSSTGKWSVQADNQHILLDPASQDWEDRPFAVVTNDELRQLTKDGTPLAADASYDLKREATAQ